MAQSDIELQTYLDAEPKGLLQAARDTILNSSSDFVFRVYEALVGDYANVIYTTAVLYVVFYALAIYRGLISATTEELINAVIRLVIVVSVLTRFDDFLPFVHNALTGWPEDIVRTVVRAVTDTDAPLGGNGALGSMDVFFDQGFKLAGLLFDYGSITSPGPWIFAAIAWLVVFLLGSIPLGMALTAEVGTAVLLGLAPIFLLYMLFKKTSGFFEAWVRSLMSLVFLKILAFTVMVLSLFMIKSPVETVKAQAIAGSLSFSDFLSLFIVAFVLWQFYKHLGGIASALGSGFVLQTSGLVEKHVAPAVASGVRAAIRWMRR